MRQLSHKCAIAFGMRRTQAHDQGNYGDQTALPEAWAKNIVSVGGIYHFNDNSVYNDAWYGYPWDTPASIGPAADGRLKPDLSFYYDDILTTTIGSSYTSGFGGTSAATPQTAGCFGLFFQMWADGIFGNDVDPFGTVFDNRPHMATAKAFMINTASPYPFTGLAHDMTRTHQGWGLPDVQFLYDMRNNLSFIDETEILSNMESRDYAAFVQPGEPMLRVTMVYTDPPGVPDVGRFLHRPYN